MHNIKVLNFSIHESKRVVSRHEGQPEDFVIDITVGTEFGDSDNQSMYLHIPKYVMEDFFKQFDAMKSKCGFISDLDRMDKITDIMSEIDLIKDQIPLSEEYQDRAEKANTHVVDAINILTDGMNKKFVLLDKKICVLEKAFMEKHYPKKEKK